LIFHAFKELELFDYRFCFSLLSEERARGKDEPKVQINNYRV